MVTMCFPSIHSILFAPSDVEAQHAISLIDSISGRHDRVHPSAESTLQRKDLPDL